MRIPRWLLIPLGVGLALIVAVFAFLFVVAPRQVGIGDRLAVLDAMEWPAHRRPVEIRWNEHLVPYITAEDDLDAAFALGVTHAHLRLGQMEIYKRVALGRLSEMAGPVANDIDAAIRALGFDRAVPDIIRMMPPETRAWFSAYVDGINHYKTHTTARPPEFVLLGLEEEPWRMEDSLAIARVGGSDVTWFSLPRLLRLRDSDSWPLLWRGLGRADGGRVGDTETGHRAPGGTGELLARVAMSMGRTGSNSIAVAPWRSASGGALMANDPHLGLTLPNAWLITGLKSPSYHGVGLMVPGFPAFALGRTEHIAWGGTNLRSWGTDLVDLPDETDTTTETHRVRTRFWFDAEAVNRLSAMGPVISDAEILKFREDEALAARWIGHTPSDELTVMLDVMRARNGPALRRIMQGFSLPAQNILYADRQGDIGRFMAAWLPNRPREFPPDIIQDKKTSDLSWQRLLDSMDLPFTTNPSKGYLVSANDRTSSDPPTRVGLVFSPKQRVQRLAALIEATPRLTPQDLMRIQQDVYSASAHAMAQTLVQTSAKMAPDDEMGRLLAQWDGRYTADSRPALVYEAVMVHLAPALFEAAGRPEAQDFWRGAGRLDIRARELLLELDAAKREELIEEAFARAHDTVDSGDAWGDRHQGITRHLLSNTPVLGRWFVTRTFPGSGARETIKKSGSDLRVDVHHPSYGSQSRHVSDMADPDANWFVLFGGQDGWFGSAAFDDQVRLWREGEAIRMPLRRPAVEQAFPLVTRFAD